MSAKFPRRKNEAFTLLELLVVIGIVGVLVWMAIPRTTICVVSGQMTSLLNNARQLQIATQMMALDTANAGGNGMEWTMQSIKGRAVPVSLATYFDALTTNNYLSEKDLKKMLTGPGRGPGWFAPTAKNIAFKFFQVEEASPSDQPLLVSANWQDGKLTDDAPYGKKGFVVFAKGGSGGVYNRSTDASSTNIFPVGKGYRYETLK